MAYDLRRLRLHGFIKRTPKSHRYSVTVEGFRAALFYTRTYARILRPGLALLSPTDAPHHPLRAAFANLERFIDAWCTALTLRHDRDPDDR